MLRDLPRFAIAHTMAAQSLRSAMSRTNDLSIFTLSNGNIVSWLRDEYPVPKSSNATVMPMLLSWRSDGKHSDADSIRAVSVISSSNRSGSHPERARASATTPHRLALRNCVGGELTE